MICVWGHEQLLLLVNLRDVWVSFVAALINTCCGVSCLQSLAGCSVIDKAGLWHMIKVLLVVECIWASSFTGTSQTIIVFVSVCLISIEFLALLSLLILRLGYTWRNDVLLVGDDTRRVFIFLSKARSCALLVVSQHSSFSCFPIHGRRCITIERWVAEAFRLLHLYALHVSSRCSLRYHSETFARFLVQSITRLRHQIVFFNLSCHILVLVGSIWDSCQVIWCAWLAHEMSVVAITTATSCIS